MLGSDLCKDNAAVKTIDKKVIEYFDLKETQYLYKEIIAKINAQMTLTIMDDICSDCSWYPVSSCKKIVCH